MNKPNTDDGTLLKSTDLLAVRIRSLIADKGMVTATANLDLARGGEWRCGYQVWHSQIDTEINALLSEANNVLQHLEGG